MYADIAAKTHQVQFAIVGFYEVEQFSEFGIFEERAIADSSAYSYGFLWYDSAGADILVSNFTVSHSTFGQAHIFAAGMDKAVWVFGHKHIVCGGICGFDGVVFIFVRVWIMSPSIANNQQERSFIQDWFCHKDATFQTE